MTNREVILKKVKAIEKIRYDNGVVHYCLIEKYHEDGYDFIGYVNKKEASKMARLKGIKIKESKKTVCALNFTPFPIPDGIAIR